MGRDWLRELVYGGWDVTKCAVCKLEIQESWWWNSAGIWWPKKLGEVSAGTPSPSWWPEDSECGGGKGVEKMVLSLKKERENLPLSTFFFYLGLQPIWWCLPILVMVDILYLVYQFKCQSLPETPCQSLPETPCQVLHHTGL